MSPSQKYRPFPPVPIINRQWPNRQMTQPPIWCSVDLRDGNQALAVPMNVSQKLEMFEALDPYLGSEDSQPPYEELSARLGSTPGAVRLLVHRLRKKFRALLEREIGKTVTNPEEIDEELAWLRKVMTE